MTNIISLKRHRLMVVDLLERILKDLAFYTISPTEREATMAYLAAMRQDTRDLQVTCVLQGDETGRTVVTLTVVPQNIIRTPR